MKSLPSFVFAMHILTGSAHFVKVEQPIGTSFSDHNMLYSS